MEPMYWLIAMAILLVIEIITMGLTTIWFAAGALAAVVAALFHAPLIVQCALFLTVSVVLFCFTRPIAEKYLNNSRTKTNINSIIGEEAKVTEEIDNFNQKGAVVVRGLEWTARSVNDNEIIPEGSKVKVKEVNGVKLLVEKQNW
ncbi:MAG: NfeD family protein [Butyribacter sp.]|mgnify:FL=1|jgi:putative membrane protein|uniref:NfeD family protein n=1 Tax=Butyribacter sp. TaxID=2822465 RepID=UPI00384A1E9D|nr:NfeD family protein [Clostridium sp.]MCQ5164761.1 NfeD family protein [Roseburia hominis]